MNESEKKKDPTKEDLRANNREQRLANNWAHVCKCGRKFTTHSGIQNHLMNYHGVKFTPNVK